MKKQLLFLDSVDSYRFTDQPIPLSRDVYDDAKARYISRIKGVEETLAVYQFGNVTVPGISDIDLIVVLKDQFNQSPNKLRLNPGDNLPGKPVFLHNPIFVPETVWPKLNWLHAPKNIIQIYGNNLRAPQTVPKLYSPFTALSTGIEFAVWKLHQLVEMHLRRFISIRRSLAIIQSITYLGELLCQFGCESYADEFHQHTHLSKQIRGNWFDHPDLDYLLVALQKTAELIFLFNQGASKKLDSVFTSIQDMRFEIYHHSSRAVSYFSQKEVLDDMVGGVARRWLGQELWVSKITLPNTYGLHYLVCALISGANGYGKLILERLRYTSKSNDWFRTLPYPYLEAIRVRMNAADFQLHFLQTRRFECGSLINCGVLNQPRKRSYFRKIRGAPELGLQQVFLQFQLRDEWHER